MQQDTHAYLQRRPCTDRHDGTDEHHGTDNHVGTARHLGTESPMTDLSSYLHLCQLTFKLADPGVGPTTPI